MRKKVIIIVCGLLIATALGSVICAHLYGRDSWMRHRFDAQSGQDEGGNYWIGAAKPVLTIHEFIDYDCPHCPGTHQMVRRAIGSRLDRIRLVRHDYARMKCAPNSAEIRSKRCDMVRAAICAGRKNRFWDWNDAVVSDPRVTMDGRKKMYIEGLADKFRFDRVEFDKCMFEPKVIEQSQRIYEETRRARVQGTPTYMVDGRHISVNDLLARIRDI